VERGRPTAGIHSTWKEFSNGFSFRRYPRTRAGWSAVAVRSNQSAIDAPSSVWRRDGTSEYVRGPVSRSITLAQPSGASGGSPVFRGSGSPCPSGGLVPGSSVGVESSAGPLATEQPASAAKPVAMVARRVRRCMAGPS
jgi:hypothetical protein